MSEGRNVKRLEQRNDWRNAIEAGGNSVGAHQAVIYSESRIPVRRAGFASPRYNGLQQ